MSEANGQNTESPWHVEVVGGHRFAGLREVTLRCRIGGDQADAINRTDVVDTESDRDSVWGLAQIFLGDAASWQAFLQAKDQFLAGKNALELAEAKVREAGGNLDVLRLTPEQKGWAGKLQHAEATLAERQAELKAAQATVASLERAVRAAAAAARPALEDAVNRGWHQLASRREEAFQAALSEVAKALEPVLPGLLAAESLRRPLGRPTSLIGSMLSVPELDEEAGEPDDE